MKTRLRLHLIGATTLWAASLWATAAEAQPAPGPDQPGAQPPSEPAPSGDETNPGPAEAAKPAADEDGGGSEGPTLTPLGPNAPGGPPKAGADVSAHPPPPPPPPRGFSSEATASWEERDELPLAGWHGGFFLRDAEDYFRLYPRARLNLDFNNTFGSGVDDQSGPAGLHSRFLISDLRLEFGGEFLKRWSFMFGVSFGGQRIDNVSGRNQDFAAPAGVDPASDTARFSRVQGAGSTASLANVWVNYSFCPCANLMVGQFLTPFGMIARTSSLSFPTGERPIAIRSFTNQNVREMGMTLWGEFFGDTINYELSMVGGDGPNRPGVDSEVDFLGRVWVRPFGGVKAIREAHIGLSARHGTRDPEGVGYDMAALTTKQGFSLWTPLYRDSFDRLTHILPSGAQNQIGGELRIPVWRLDLRGEAYYSVFNTREAVDGFQLSNTERLGRFSGLGWYAGVTWWAFGDDFIAGTPGNFRPPKLNLRSKPKLERGLDLTAEVGQITAQYDAADRGGELDPLTPGGTENLGTDVNIWEIAAAASYWHTKMVRLMLTYSLYVTPGSGTDDNLAAVPGNLGDSGSDDAHTMHELLGRIQLSF